MGQVVLILLLSCLITIVLGQNKPGICPTPTGAGACVEECSTDGSCEGILKCCSNGCGHVCTTPILTSEPTKPGFCPRPTGAGICIQGCRGDYSCRGNLKCCSNGCGVVCTRPTLLVLASNADTMVYAPTDGKRLAAYYCYGEIF